MGGVGAEGGLHKKKEGRRVKGRKREVKMRKSVVWRRRGEDAGSFSALPEAKWRQSPLPKFS